MLRRWIAFILAAVSCLVMISAAAEGNDKASEAESECDGYRYRLLEDGTAEITEYIGKEHFLTIPETLDGYTVTSIGDEAFYLRPGSLRGITIPGTVTHIGSLAFALSELENVIIPKSVVSMGNNPFGYIETLESITVEESNPVFYVQDGVLFCREDMSLVCFPYMLAEEEYTVPDGVEKIRGSAFGGVDNLTAIHLPDGLKEIGRQAFGFCSDLDSIVIPDSVTEIGDAAFDTCKQLRSVVLPAGLTRIGAMAFYECGNLETVDIPETVTEIGESAFAFCSCLEKVRIPAGITEINDGTFEMCENLTSVIIPEGATRIGGFAFEGCFRLADVQIPETVTEIGEAAFSDCPEELVITCAADGYVQQYCTENGIAFSAR